MSFWDASALVPLVLEQPNSAAVSRLHSADAQPIVWWFTVVECASAIARLERGGLLLHADAINALARLGAIRETWNEVPASEDARRTALRFLRVHPLRAADAMQLAAAFLASEGRPETLEFVCLDGRLVDAARREGFRVTMPE